MTIRWQHKEPPAEPHPAEPRYDSAGKWVCYKCRYPLVDETGKKVDMSMAGLPAHGILTADPDAIGLHTDGS